MHGMSGETSSLPHQGPFLWQQLGDFSADKLVRDWLMTVRVELVHVAHVPSSRSDSVVVADSLFHSAELRSVGEKCVSVWVLLAANFTSTLSSIDLENGVVWAVDIGVDSQTEEMLMVVCVDSWVDFGSPALGVLTRIHSIGVEDTSKLDLQLDGTILMENPVHAVFIVRSSEDV